MGHRVNRGSGGEAIPTNEKSQYENMDYIPPLVAPDRCLLQYQGGFVYVEVQTQGGVLLAVAVWGRAVG